MKRKFFTFAAAITMMALTILPVSAAEQICATPVWFCFRPDCSHTAECPGRPGQGATPDVPGMPDVDWPALPECPNLNKPIFPQFPDLDKPIFPEFPDVEEPSVPEIPDVEEPGVPEIPDVEEPEVPTIPDAEAMSQLEAAACELINEQRQANGLAPLTISSDLSIKARVKSADMKENNYFDHNSPTYGSPYDLMKSLGITYRTAGENIAMGYPTAQAVVNAWMSSPGHRANILSTSYHSFGIGYVDGYWTQWFIG